MGKSKAMRIQTLDDGGVVPRQSNLLVQIYQETQGRITREARLAEERKKRNRQRAEYLAKDQERYAAAARRIEAAGKAVEEGRKREKEAAIKYWEEREVEEKKKKEEYDKPLPDFLPRIPQEVRGKFFQYVAHVVSDTLWSLENWADDPFGYEQENAAILGEEIPPPKPRRKKVPAECLKAALRICQLKNGWQKKYKYAWLGEPGRQEKLEGLKQKVGLQVNMHILIDVNHACFDKTDRFWLNDGDYNRDFEKRLRYRIKRNLWKEKNVPYFATFDPNCQGLEQKAWAVGWEVWLGDDFNLLKKSGDLLPDEEKVIHLEIF